MAGYADDGDALGDQEAGTGVTEVMDSDRLDLGFLDGLFEIAVGGGRGKGAIAAEDEACGRRGVSGLSMLDQQLTEERGDINGSVTAGILGGGHFPALGFGFIGYALRDLELSAFGIKVAPGEGFTLAAAASGDIQGKEEKTVGRILGGCVEFAELVGGPELHLLFRRHISRTVDLIHYICYVVIFFAVTVDSAEGGHQVRSIRRVVRWLSRGKYG